MARAAPEGRSPLHRQLRQIARTLRDRLDRRTPLHFLHLSKNAGTQIRRIGGQINRESNTHRFVPHGHEVRLDELPDGALYFFCIRDPIARFKSGFYHGKRKGQPRYYNEWTPDEAVAFSDFHEANDLAEALFSEGARGRAAAAAMRSIRHVTRFQFQNFGMHGHFLRFRPPVAILRQSRLSEDLAAMLDKLGVPMPQDPPPDDIASHRSDYSGTPPFSPLAIENLSRWYAPDLEFCRLCEAWIEAQSERH